MVDIVKTAIELLNINRDITKRLKGKRVLEYYDLKIFDQTWGDTSGGFDTDGDMCGQAITTQTTYAFVPAYYGMECFIYFGSRYAYSVPLNQKIMEDIVGMRLKPVSQVKYYKE